MSDRRWSQGRGAKAVNWVLLTTIYGAWGLVTYFHEALPVWILFPIGAILMAWHGSFQHEAVHDHFSKKRWLNDLIAYPPLSLWLPFPLYRQTHREHHSFKILTDPCRDPESFYVDRESWAALPRSLRLLLTWHNTLLGRVLIGPFLSIGQFLYAEALAVVKGDRTHVITWLIHVPATAVLLAWVIHVADMSIWLYLACFVLPGLSLTLVRSFAEHKAANTPLERTAIVEAGSFLSLLFLNNNLHYAHHRRPDLPWQALPRYYSLHREALLRENGKLLYAGGYRELVRRFLIRPVDHPQHPFC